MRARALLLVLLSLGWLLPAGAAECPGEPIRAAEQTRSHGAEHRHGGGSAAPAAAHEHPQTAAYGGTRRSEPDAVRECCGIDPMAAQPLLSAPQPPPRPDAFVPTRSAAPGGAQPAARRVSVRRSHLGPSAAPYASSRRPLLI